MKCQDGFGGIEKNMYLCAQIQLQRNMKSKLLKLDAPYNVIYAGGYVGRHVAKLVTWKED